MGNKSIILLVVLGLIIIVAVAAFLVFNPMIPSKEEAGITPPEATGDIDDLVDALEKEITDEMNLVYEEQEATLITSDAALIDDFGQAADDAGL